MRLRCVARRHDILATIMSKSRLEAFSDGVNTDGATQKWYARDDEAGYYKSIFNAEYSNAAKVIPHMWMPKWVETNDPSATSYLSSMNS
jgi:hypothetical protein